MLDEAETGIFAGIRKKSLQSLLAVRQWQRAQILVAFEQKIEGEIEECIGLALGGRRLKSRKIRGAVFVERAYLAIDDRIRQLVRGLCDWRIFSRPIEALAGLQ